MNQDDGQFNYDRAFARNIGWVTENEQGVLRRKRIAIAGMGGVGGVHLLTLARFGVSSFNIADFDVFDIVNFNRQAGATIDTLGKPKVNVLAEMALSVNPELNIAQFENGVNPENIDQFLHGVDVYVDGLDFFAFEARRMIFSACSRLGIPAVTAAPLGLGTALLVFLPGMMTFEEYFRLDGCDEEEMAIRFLLGLSPAMLQRGYLVDRSRVNLEEQRGPSTIAACQLCAGVTAAEVMKILLGRGTVRSAPWGYQFDAYRRRFVETWRPWGNGNPIQLLALWFARRELRNLKM